MLAAVLSLANASAGVPAGLSAMLAAAASQSTFATEMCGLFISWAGAALPISNARPARMARFTPLPSLCPVSQGLTLAAELKASNSGIQGLHSGVGCGAIAQRTPPGGR